jgi:hypothetical protein
MHWDVYSNAGAPSAQERLWRTLKIATFAKPKTIIYNY